MADFQFYLNRQGAKGEKGDKGDKGNPGNTPIPSTGTNTSTEYTIVWDLGDGNSFETGNLKQPTVDQGGTTLRYDRANDQIILGEPDLANTANMTPGIVYLADDERIENEDVQDDDAVTYKVFKDKTDDIQEQITAVEDDLDNLADKVDQNADDIESLDGRLDDEEANMLIVQGNITTLNNTKASKTELSSGLATKANVVHNHTMSQITDAGALAKKNTVDYATEVTNKPTIPTVGDGTITITQGGVTKGTFTVNQSSNSTIDLDAGGGGGTSFTAGTGLELTNQDVLNVKIDGSTITTNPSGQLVANVSSPSYTAGDGIVINNNVISAKVDNDTMLINSSGQLVANIPAPETVDQTYDATSTHAQSGVAIASAGFITRDSVQYPLEYVNLDLKTQNIANDGSISNTQGYFNLNDGYLYCYYNNTYSNFSTVYNDWLNSPDISYVENDLNSLNHACNVGVYENSTNITFLNVLGYYNDTTFIPTLATYGNASNWNGYIGSFTFTSSGYSNQITLGGYNSNPACYTIAINDTILDCERIWGSTTSGTTRNFLTFDEAEQVSLSTHIRSIPVKWDDTSSRDGIISCNLSDIIITNPTTFSYNSYSDFSSDTNIMEYHPSGLLLNYDSNTLGVNASNELTVPTATTSNLGLVKPDGTTITINNGVISSVSSTPSNMVTTDTAQTISGQKTFSSYYTYMGNSKARIGAINGNNGTLMLGITDVSNADNYHSVLFKNSNGHLVLDLGLTSGTKFYVNRNGSAYYTTTVNNFFLEKGMLDGTTITYDSNTGKISANVGSSGIGIGAPVTPLNYTPAYNVVGSFSTEFMTQDVTNTNIYIPDNTNGTITIPYSDPTSLTSLRIKHTFKSKSTLSGSNNTFFSGSTTYRYFLPTLYTESGTIKIDLPVTSTTVNTISLGSLNTNTIYNTDVTLSNGNWTVIFNGSTYTYNIGGNSISYDGPYNNIKLKLYASHDAQYIDMSDTLFSVNDTIVYKSPSPEKLTIEYDSNALSVDDNNKLTLSNVYKVLKKTFDINKFAMNGTPTISIDGIATDFNSSNNIKTIQCKDLNGHSWKFRQRFYYDSSRTGTSCIINQSGSWVAQGGIVLLTTPTRVVFNAKTGNSSESSNEGAKITLNNVLSNSGYYIVESEFNLSTGVYTLSLFDDNNTLLGNGDWTATTTEKQLYAIALNSTNYIRLGYGSDLSGDPIPLDLKESYIYKDSSEIFNGNKSDITVLVNRNIDSTGYVECWSDNVLEQGGTCTANTTVVFTEPFVDSNYILTVPYSSKTNTGFTPTVTGDWIAKGLIRAQAQISRSISNMRTLNLSNDFAPDIEPQDNSIL